MKSAEKQARKITDLKTYLGDIERHLDRIMTEIETVSGPGMDKRLQTYSSLRAEQRNLNKELDRANQMMS